MVLSCVTRQATSTPAEVAAVNGSQSKIFQLYLRKDRALSSIE